MREGIILEIKNTDAIILTKEGEFISLPTEESWAVGQKVLYTDIERRKQRSIASNKSRLNTAWKNKIIAVAIVASLLFFMIPFSITSQASTFITLDINPSIQLEVSEDKVIQLIPLNQDGEKVIEELALEEDLGDVYEVTDKIIETASYLGYLNNDIEELGSETFIMVGIMDENRVFEIAKYKEYLEQNLAEIQVKAEVMVLNATKKDKQTADSKGLSIGKYMLQAKEKEQGIEISDEQLKKENINEIMKQVKEKSKEKEKNKNANGNNGNKENNGNSGNKGNKGNNGKGNENSNENSALNSKSDNGKKDKKPDKNEQQNQNNGNQNGNLKKEDSNNNNEKKSRNVKDDDFSNNKNKKDKNSNSGNAYGKSTKYKQKGLIDQQMYKLYRKIIENK